MKVAIIHDWLTAYAGGEKVLEQLLEVYPDADLFAVCDFLSDQDRSFLNGKVATTTFIQHMPWARKHYRQYLPLMPLAIEQLDMSKYELVISSSHAVAKGVLVGPDQLHVSYIHTPIRYAWDLQHQYLKESSLERGVKSWLARILLHKIRQWDVRTANGVDVFVANSNFISRRISKAYRRESRVIYPPVDVSTFRFSSEKEHFYLTASRLVPYKRIDVIVEAFREMPDHQLVVIGDGPERLRLEKLAQGCSNIEIKGYQPTHVLADYMRRAKAFVFAAEEDFGITPLEAQASGTPVIAFGRGGALETVRGLDRSNPTGIFFREQSPQHIVQAVTEFDRCSSVVTPQACRENALSFSSARFRAEIREFVDCQLDLFRKRQR